MSFFPFALWIDKGKPFYACMGSLLVGLYRQFHLMNNKVTKHDLENIPCHRGESYCQLNQSSTCFAVLIHSTSTLLCSTVSMELPGWFNFFFIQSANSQNVSFSRSEYWIDSELFPRPELIAFIFHAQLVHIVIWGTPCFSMIQIDPAHDLHPARTHLSHCIAVSAFYLLLSMTSSLSGSHFSCPSPFEGLPIQSFSTRIVFTMRPKWKSKLKEPTSYNVSLSAYDVWGHC